jgi:hypothetical protein
MALHTYTPYEWKNAPDHKTTPLSADNLNHIEQGIKNAEDDIASVASDITPYTESGSTASRAYKFGDLIYIGGTLYRAVANIASGATFTINTNVVSVAINGLVPFKIIYDGNITYTNGQGSVAIANQLMFPLVARCMGADVPTLVSISSTGNLMHILLPTSPGFSGALRTIIYGVDLR